MVTNYPKRLIDAITAQKRASDLHAALVAQQKEDKTRYEELSQKSLRKADTEKQMLTTIALHPEDKSLRDALADFRDLAILEEAEELKLYGDIDLRIDLLDSGESSVDLEKAVQKHLTNYIRSRLNAEELDKDQEEIIQMIRKYLLKVFASGNIHRGADGMDFLNLNRLGMDDLKRESYHRNVKMRQSIVDNVLSKHAPA